MLNNQQISNRIKQLAKSKNIPLKTMLSDLDMGINTISQMSGRQNISLDVLNPIALYLGCDTDYLLGFTDDPAPAQKEKEPGQTAQLSPEEDKFITLLRQASPEKRAAILALLE